MQFAAVVVTKSRRCHQMLDFVLLNFYVTCFIMVGVTCVLNIIV